MMMMNTNAGNEMIDTDVFQQNNLGVMFLSNGDLNGAYRQLHHAFALARRHVEEEAKQNQYTARRRRRRTFGWLTCPREQNLGHVLASGATPSSANSSGVRNVLSQGLMMCLDYSKLSNNGDQTNHDNTTSMMDWTLVSAFCIYNLGLVYDAASLVAGDGRSQLDYLRKSSMMLESARRLLLNLMSTTPSRHGRLIVTGNALVDWLSLSLLHKLAETNSSLSNKAIARAYALQLDALVGMLLNDNETNDDNMRQLLRANGARLVCDLSTSGAFLPGEEEEDNMADVITSSSTSASIAPAA